MDGVAIRGFVRDRQLAHEDAVEAWVEVCHDIAGIDPETARKALETYRACKAVRFSQAGRRYTVTHGMFLDAPVLRKAAAAWGGV